MNQTLPTVGAEVLAAVLDAGLFSSLCTIREASGDLSAIGQPLRGSADFSDVSGLVDIPCMAAPDVILNISGSAERRFEDRFADIDVIHVLLDAHYPAIQKDHQAVVDGTPYNIKGIEHDSQGTQTRLKLEVYSL